VGAEVVTGTVVTVGATVVAVGVVVAVATVVSGARVVDVGVPGGLVATVVVGSDVGSVVVVGTGVVTTDFDPLFARWIFFDIAASAGSPWTMPLTAGTTASDVNSTARRGLGPMNVASMNTIKAVRNSARDRLRWTTTRREGEGMNRHRTMSMRLECVSHLVANY
jgi:hypothetical protein